MHHHLWLISPLPDRKEQGNCTVQDSCSKLPEAVGWLMCFTTAQFWNIHAKAELADECNNSWKTGFIPEKLNIRLTVISDQYPSHRKITGWSRVIILSLENTRNDSSKVSHCIHWPSPTTWEDTDQDMRPGWLPPALLLKLGAGLRREKMAVTGSNSWLGGHIQSYVPPCTPGFLEFQYSVYDGF